MVPPPNWFLCFITYAIAREKQRERLGSGAIADGETDAKNASVDGPLGAVYTYDFPHESPDDLMHIRFPIRYKSAPILIWTRLNFPGNSIFPFLCRVKCTKLNTIKFFGKY
jgi:hypothetical protein